VKRVLVAVAVLAFLIDLNPAAQSRSYPGALPPSDSEAACRELIDIGALTVMSADVRTVARPRTSTAR
jgi:hypothetical protein